MSIEEQVQEKLFYMQDLSYKEFHKRLIPTVDPDSIIGVRTPELRKFAKEFSKTSEAAEFLKILPHKFYEENNLHGFIIETIKDYDTCIYEVNRFLPYINNWATCDMLSLKKQKKHLEKLLAEINVWLQSDHTYTIRFGIEMLMSFYLDDAFKPEYLEKIAAIKSEEYYVNMMIAWFFATALAKQYDAVLPYIENKKFDTWVHNKTIQKAIESNRIDKEKKTYLKGLKVR